MKRELIGVNAVPTILQEDDVLRSAAKKKRRRVVVPGKYNVRTEKDLDWDDLPLEIQYQRVWSQIMKCRRQINKAQKRMGELDLLKRKVAREARKKGVRFETAFDGEKVHVMMTKIDKDFEGD